MDRLEDKLLELKEMLEKAANDPNVGGTQLQLQQVNPKKIIRTPEETIKEKERAKEAAKVKHAKKWAQTEAANKHFEEPEVKKSMNNVGVGGAGKIKAGAVLPSINQLPKLGNASLAGKVKIP